MSYSQKKTLLFAIGFFQLLSVISSEISTVDKQELLQEHFDSNINQLSEKNFTGFRSAFQWTYGETINKTGLHNSMTFQVNDSVNVNYLLFGQIGIYTNDSKIGVHFSLSSVKSSIPGSSFFCSSDFPYWKNVNSCFNSNFSLTSNAIYFLDVEIRGNTIRGYISDPQRDLYDMDDPYLPRHLIAEVKWFNELENLKPNGYWLSNDFKSCNLLSEVITYNFAPQVYNKKKRQNTAFKQYSTYKLCGPQETLMLIDWSENIAIYISKTSPEIYTKLNSLEIAENTFNHI